MATPASSLRPFFDGVWAHFEAKNGGLPNPPKRSSPVPFLVVEDFETNGLAGDPTQWSPFGSDRNSFFLFFRAFGRSGKEGEDRGRWGVGKFVFPLASAGSCWFGLTVPWNTGVPSLMGRVVLKTHGTDAQSYHPDGHWGLRSASNDLVMPDMDANVIADFRSVFAVRRRSEPGLSVVVPWLSEDVTAAALKLAVATEYFLPILRGELVVEIDDNGSVERIDRKSMRTLAEAIEDERARSLVRLAVAVSEFAVDELQHLPHRLRYATLDWRDDNFSDALAADLLARLEAGRPIGVRVPIEIKPKDELQKSTHFDVFLQQAAAVGRQRPLIVRESITIAEERTTPLQGYSALVIIDDPPLAALVGDSESPAHNELQYQLIKDKYTFAGKVLALLRSVATNVIHTIERSARDDDPFLLAQYFPIDDDEDRKRGTPAPKAKTGLGPAPPPPEIPPGRARFRVSRVDGGFSVRGAEGAVVWPEEITVRFAYVVRRGNPFRRYQPLDFSLKNGDLQVKVEDVDVVDTDDNRIVVRPLALGFAFTILGFDRNRDVIVKVDAS